MLDLPPLPNDIAFAPDGDDYVTDSMQATIWRIPKGGGTPKISFQSSKFASPYIGTNGLRLRPDGTKRARLTNPQGSLTAPYDGPANIAFDGTGNILMTNHAPVTGLVARKFSIVDVDVDGARLFTPMIG